MSCSDGSIDAAAAAAAANDESNTAPEQIYWPRSVIHVPELDLACGLGSAGRRLAALEALTPDDAALIGRDAIDNEHHQRLREVAAAQPGACALIPLNLFWKFATELARDYSSHVIGGRSKPSRHCKNMQRRRWWNTLPPRTMLRQLAATLS